MMHLSGSKENEIPTPLLNAGKFSRVANPFWREGARTRGGTAATCVGGEFLLASFCSFWTHWTSCLYKDNSLVFWHHLFPSPQLAPFTFCSSTALKAGSPDTWAGLWVQNPSLLLLLVRPKASFLLPSASVFLSVTWHPSITSLIELLQDSVLCIKHLSHSPVCKELQEIVYSIWILAPPCTASWLCITHLFQPRISHL